jgi:hypothetical protein
VTVVVTGAATATALIRVDGGVPTARAALAIVRSRRRPLAAWALVSAVVGVLLILLSRVGIAGVVAQLAATIGWAAATMFAVPIVISQGTMPAGAVRQSARMVRANFWMVALLVAGAHPYGIHIWVALFCLGAGVLFFVGVVSAGLAAYLNTILFRFAVGQPIPGVDPPHLSMPSAAS